jgi:pyruvate dehydrogenase E1 component beta subunit
MGEEVAECKIKLAIEAVDLLITDDIFAEVIDLRTIRHLDIDAIVASVCKANRVVIVVDECWFFAGVGTSIGSIIMRDTFDYLDAPIEFVNAQDVPLPYAANLEKLALPSVDTIVSAARKLVLHL